MHLPRVWAEINLSVIAENLRRCRELLAADCEVLGVVKADAYGHGATRVARNLETEGVAMLGVGDSHEAIQLRESGITAPILILGAVVEGEIPELVHHGITPMIHSPERIHIFNRVARELDVRLGVHLLIDTGMSRLGVSPEHASEHLAAISEASHLRLEGVGTHFAAVDEDPPFTATQLARFESALQEAKQRGVPIPRRHVASSAALLSCPQSHFDMVRLGGLLYGISPGTRQVPGLTPALSLHTQVVYLRDLPAGSSVGYGRTHTARSPMRVATLPVGYHDGYLHGLSNRAEVLVLGHRAPVVGRITMDYFMVDVTRIPGVQVGEHVTLLGANGDDEITAHDLSRWAETIPYEVPCQLGPRVRRFYSSGTESERKAPESGATPSRIARYLKAKDLFPRDRSSLT